MVISQLRDTELAIYLKKPCYIKHYNVIIDYLMFL